MEIKEHAWNWALGSDIRRGEQGVRDSVMQEAPSVCYSCPFRGDSSSGKPVYWLRELLTVYGGCVALD